MVMSEIGRVGEAPADDPAAALEAAARLLERSALDAPVTQAERSYLGATATRLAGMAARLRADTEAEAEAAELEPLPRRPMRHYSRKEAATLIGVAPNTLLNWEARGLLPVQRDWRGWRVYGREELARAMAMAAHLPLAELPADGTDGRRPRRR